MRSYIDRYCGMGEIAFPMDIDEFIVHFNYDTNQLSSDKEIILNYINNLPPYNVYKMNYIMSIYTINDIEQHPDGFINATSESKYGQLCEFNVFSKGFINTNLNKHYIDMGNHFLTYDYYKTNLCLIHFHCRNLNQIKKKVLNNILGLGYENNLEYLIELNKKDDVKGIHHVNNQIAILTNNFKMEISHNDIQYIDLVPFNNCINHINNSIETIINQQSDFISDINKHNLLLRIINSKR